MNAPLTIASAIQTCRQCPSQWDAWTTDGRYMHLRYRWGHGTVDIHPNGYRGGDGVELASFCYGDAYDGTIDLDTFCDLAGIALAPDAVIR